LSGGAAWAKSKAATGSVSCTGVAATINFKPPLLPTGTKKEKVTLTGVAETGCTDSNGNAQTATSVKVTIKATSSTDSCAAFATGTGADTVTVATKWAGGIAPTTVTFAPGSVAINGSNTGFNATGGVIKHGSSFDTGTGSFDVTIADTSQLVACIGGSGSVSSLQINGGTATA